MCKHVAAVLYGIGARLDEKPDLLFTLRKVDQQELITSAGTSLSRSVRPPAPAKLLANANLSELFGIDIADVTEPRKGKAATRSRRPTPRA
jgi:uncharacterized Zn finger protein